MFHSYAQPNRKYMSVMKYEGTKQDNDKWREPPAIEFVIPVSKKYMRIENTDTED